MLPSDTRTAAIPVVLARLQEVLRLWRRAGEDEKAAEAALADAKARKSAADAQLNQCVETAKLFGFDLKEEWDKHLERWRREQAEAPPAAVPPSAPPISERTLEAAMAPSPKTIKDHAIDAAKHAYPKPIRASALRQQLESIGIKTHEKTVGMTLYRLSVDGVLRRNGWDWFFVPEAERTATVAMGEEGSGDEPELSMAAAE